MKVVQPRVKAQNIHSGHPKRTLAVDFDGVIHNYSRGWQGGVIYDELVPGAYSALLHLSKYFELVCFTARHDLQAVEDYLTEKHLRHLFSDVTNRKPAAFAYLDDRGIRFESWAQALLVLLGDQLEGA